MTDEFEEEHFEEKPFLEHLEDLRMTLFKIIVTTVVAAVVCLALSQRIFDVLRAPLRQHATLVSVKKTMTQPEEAEPSPKPAGEQQQEGPPPPQPGTRVVVTGPLGSFIMLARDLFIYSKEAVVFLQRRATDPDTKTPAASEKKSTKPPKKVARKGKKASSGKKEKSSPVVTLIETGPTKGFMVVIKTSFICGLGIALPLNIFFLAQFVFPALTRKEKKYVTPSFLIGGVLFVLGVLFGYLLTLPLALRIFLQLNERYGLENIWRMSEYLGTVSKLLIANGVMFEMPLLLTILVRIGVLSVTTLRKKRRHAMVIILFAAAMLTPPDPPTMFMLAAPMIVMYEACIWASWFLMRKKRLQEQQEEEQESYWEERKRVKEAEKVEPEDKQHETPGEQPPAEQDSGAPPEDTSEDYGYEDQSGSTEWPEEHDYGDGDMHDNFPEPDEESPDQDEEKPDRHDD